MLMTMLYARALLFLKYHNSYAICICINICYNTIYIHTLYTGTGVLDFESFCRVALFFNEEDAEALQKELKEAFRLYDREGKYSMK